MALNEFASNVRMKPSLYFRIVKVIKRNAATGYYSYFDQNEMLNELPTALRNEVLGVTHQNILSSFPFFKDKPPQFVLDILPMFHHISLTANEIIFRKGDWVGEIYFVLKGRVSIVTDEGIKFRNFAQGSYFGDVEFFKQKVF